MPTTNYTATELSQLSTSPAIENFGVRSFTFYNTKSGLVIQDAIILDEFGNLIFKDTVTVATLAELVEGSRGIIEELDEDGNPFLYFRDNFNDPISLGRIFEILFKNRILNGTFWFGKRSSKFLDDEMDEYILQEFYIRKEKESSLDPRELNITIEETQGYKNIWFDVPCIEVITPDYVNNKYASISATVSFKVKSEVPVITAFRIYDATADIELSRTVHFIHRESKEFVEYQVPLAYQGPLPDTEILPEGTCKRITLRDLQNIQVLNKKERGSVITQNPDGWSMVPVSRHVLKLQWATCSVALELDNIGNRIGDFKRQFEPKGETSLDVTIFYTKVSLDDFSQVNGRFAIDDPNVISQQGGNKYRVVFENLPASLDQTYAVQISKNKNFEAWIIESDFDGFTVQWNRNVRGGIIDWSVIQQNRDADIELLEMTDKTRVLNHNLFFPSREVKADFCEEVEEECPEPLPPPPIPQFVAEGCECCDCCEWELEIKFEVQNGLKVKPKCPYFEVTDDFNNTRYSLNDNFQFKPILTTINPNCPAGFNHTLTFDDANVTSGKTVTAEYHIEDINCGTHPIVSIPDPTEKLTINDFFPEWSTTPENFGNITQYANNSQTLFGEDFTYAPLEYDTDEEFLEVKRIINVAKEEALKKLKFDILQRPGELPAHNLSEEKVNLVMDFDEPRYELLIDRETKELKMTDPMNLIYVLVTTPAFLGAKYFAYTFVIFDPRPNIILDPGERPIFPGHDPIGFRTTKKEINEYIYTTIYPSPNIPVFPNFKIGDVAIDGAQYNPLFDIRCYRLVGGYIYLNKRSSENEIFESESLPISSIIVRSFVPDEAYITKRDPYNSSPIQVSTFGNRIQSVIGSGVKFSRLEDGHAAESIAEGYSVILNPFP